MKKKYWIAVGEHPMFTRDDHHVLQVFLTGQPNERASCLLPKFVDAESLEDARIKMHAFIDERIDHEKHMVKIDVLSIAKEKIREKIRQIPMVADTDVNQLTIGGLVNEDVKAPRSKTDGLINLDDLLG